MSLHQAEWVAGELIALVVFLGVPVWWVWWQHQRQEPPPDDPGRDRTTQYSSMQDD